MSVQKLKILGTLSKHVSCARTNLQKWKERYDAKLFACRFLEA